MFIDIGKFIVNSKKEGANVIVKKVINTNRILSLHQCKVPPKNTRAGVKRRAKTVYYILMHGDRVEYQINKQGFEFLYSSIVGDSE